MNPLASINCVRWSSSGDTFATASDDQSAKVIDFKTGKVIYSGTDWGISFCIFSLTDFLIL